MRSPLAFHLVLRTLNGVLYAEEKIYPWDPKAPTLASEELLSAILADEKPEAVLFIRLATSFANDVTIPVFHAALNHSPEPPDWLLDYFSLPTKRGEEYDRAAHARKEDH